MELGTLISTGSATIDLATKLAEIVEKYQAAGSSVRMTAIINELRKAAVDMTQGFSDELAEIHADFFSSGIDVEKSLIELNADLSWYDFRTRMKVSSYEKKFKSLYERLAGFLDDSIAVAICDDSKEPLSDALASATERSYRLNKALDPNAPLKEVFTVMHEIVRELLEQFRGRQIDYA